MTVCDEPERCERAVHERRVQALRDDAAERRLVGALMHADRPDVASDLLAVVNEDDLFHGRHRIIVAAIRDQLADRRGTDPVTLADRLRRDGDLEHVGGQAHLSELAGEGAAGPVPAFGDVDTISRLARRRRTVNAGRRIVERSTDHRDDLDAIAADAVEWLGSHGHSAGLQDASELVESALSRHESDGELLGWPAPWSTLASSWRIVPGWLHVVTGFPSAGKSALIDPLMVGLAADSGVDSVVWAPESAPTPRHLLRLAAIRAGRPERMLTSGEIAEHAEWVTDHVTWINHDTRTTVPQVLAQAQAHVMRNDRTRLLVIDPFTDLDKGSGEEAWDRLLDRELNRLRRWARRHEAAVVVVAHPKGIPRGASGLYPVASVSDLHGGALWRNRVDSAVSVWRDELGLERPCEQVDVHVQKVRDDGPGGRMGAMRTLHRHESGRYAPVDHLREVV